jgi:hypothetical protein
MRDLSWSKDGQKLPKRWSEVGQKVDTRNTPLSARKGAFAFDILTFYIKRVLLVTS